MFCKLLFYVEFKIGLSVVWKLIKKCFVFLVKNVVLGGVKLVIFYDLRNVEMLDLFF